MDGFWRKVAAVCLAAAAIAASVAVATAATGGSGKKSSSHNARRSADGGPRVIMRADPGEQLSALAKELGVSNSDLRDALDAVRQKLGPPKRPDGPPTRAEMEKRCNEFTDALASQLNKSGDDVRAAIKAVTKAHIADDVKAGRLTQAQADKILERLDSAACLPVLGGPGGPHGCAGPPPGMPPASGARRGSGTSTAPQGGPPALEFAPAA